LHLRGDDELPDMVVKDLRQPPGRVRIGLSADRPMNYLPAARFSASR
jgi:hypothetical protein